MATAKSRTRSRPKMSIESPADPPRPVGVTVAPPPPAQPSAPPGLPSASEQAAAKRQASRIGKRAVTFYVSPDAFRQLGVFAAQSDRTVQDLMQEALDLLFQH